MIPVLVFQVFIWNFFDTTGGDEASSAVYQLSHIPTVFVYLSKDINILSSS